MTPQTGLQRCDELRKKFDLRVIELCIKASGDVFRRGLTVELAERAVRQAAEELVATLESAVRRSKR